VVADSGLAATRTSPRRTIRDESRSWGDESRGVSDGRRWGPSVTVKAGDDGGAQISWTPSESGFYDLDAYVTTKDGIQLALDDY
jgi:hypothetical protein